MIDVQAEPDALDVTDWASIAPRYEELLGAPLTESAVRPWLAAWSDLSASIREGASLLSIAYSQDTADPDREAQYFGFLGEVAPRIAEQEHALRQRLMDSGLAPDDVDLALTWRRFEADVAIHREENLPLIAEARTLAARYGKTIGGLTVEIDGDEKTLAQLSRLKGAAQRSTRERAWRAEMDARMGVRAELDDLFDQLLELRNEISSNAGFDNFRDYVWLQKARLDYGPDDAREFRDAIEQHVVPALKRQSARMARELRVDALRPWDTDADPYGDRALDPFATGEELAETSHRIFQRVDPVLGEYFQQMRSAELLDLENRKGKAPGGYCATLTARKLPFIFMNAVGTDRNVRTMLHEAGHAFHVFETRHLPYFWQRRSPMEFAEVASMSMELLSAPFLEDTTGGFYERRDAIRARIRHLERMIRFLPYMAVVDGFQHWMYAEGAPDRDARDAAWLSLHERFCVEADWHGLREIRENSWQHKLHIFQAPFYYIEYGIAQLGALQVWRNSISDPEAALSDYRSALALGGTRSLPELFEAAGATLAFDADTVGELTQLVERSIDDLREQLQSDPVVL